MAVLTLAEAKTQVNASSTVDDAEMQAWVDSVTSVIERLIGGPAENRSVVETAEVADGDRALILSQRPVLSVTSITAGGVAVSSSDAVASRAGVVRRSTGLAFGTRLTAPVVVTYTAGLGVTAPAEVKQAAKLLFQSWWSTQRGGQARGGMGDSTQQQNLTPGYGYSIPNGVLLLLDKYIDGTGI